MQQTAMIQYEEADAIPTSFMKHIKAKAMMRMAQADADKSRDLSMKYDMAKEAVLEVVKQKDGELFTLIKEIYKMIEDEPSTAGGSKKKQTVVLNDDGSDSDEDQPLKRTKPGSKPTKPGSKPAKEAVQEGGNKKGKKRGAPQSPSEFPKKNGQAGFIQYWSPTLKEDYYTGTDVMQEGQQRHRRCSQGEKVTYNILAELMNLHAEKEHLNVRRTLKPNEDFKAKLKENFIDFFKEPAKIGPLIEELKVVFSKHQKFANYVGKPIPSGPDDLPPFPVRLPYPCPAVCEDNDGNEVRLDEQKDKLDANGNVIGKFKSMQMTTDERFEARKKHIQKLRSAEEAEAEDAATKGAEAEAEAEAEVEEDGEDEEEEKPKKKKKKVAFQGTDKAADEVVEELDV
jgi:hypothetical protein